MRDLYEKIEQLQCGEGGSKHPVLRMAAVEQAPGFADLARVPAPLDGKSP